jgi:hypothetical protein
MILWSAAMPITPDNKLRLASTGILSGYPATGSITSFTFRTPWPDEKPHVRYAKPA